MVKRTQRPLRDEPREGEIGDVQTGALRSRGVAAGKLRGTFREAEEADEDA